MICWVCRVEDGSSREHKFKKSDIKRVFGNGPYVGEYAPVHVKDGSTKKIQGANSNAFKYSASICEKCNNSVTQPFDFAYEKFVEHVFNHEDAILTRRFIDFEAVFGADYASQQTNLYKYFVKSFGCQLAEAGRDVPKDLSELMSKKQFETALYMNFAVHEDVLLMKKNDRDGFIGFGGLLAYQDKQFPDQVNGYEWNQHVSWLFTNFWYGVSPNGNLGSPWVADNRHIYLGSIRTLDADQVNELSSV